MDNVLLYGQAIKYLLLPIQAQYLFSKQLILLGYLAAALGPTRENLIIMTQLFKMGNGINEQIKSLYC